MVPPIVGEVYHQVQECVITKTLIHISQALQQSMTVLLIPLRDISSMVQAGNRNLYQLVAKQEAIKLPAPHVVVLDLPSPPMPPKDVSAKQEAGSLPTPRPAPLTPLPTATFKQLPTHAQPAKLTLPLVPTRRSVLPPPPPPPPAPPPAPPPVPSPPMPHQPTLDVKPPILDALNATQLPKAVPPVMLTKTGCWMEPNANAKLTTLDPPPTKKIVD